MFDQSKETMTTLEPKQKPENSKRPLNRGRSSRDTMDARD